MIIKLENEKFIVCIETNGAELCQMRLKDNNTEFIWQGERGWNGHSPFLFPIVGRLKNGKYSHEGKEYSMSIHGFARDFNWDIVSQNESCVVLQFTSNEQTKSVYPFDFCLLSHFTLNGNNLEIKRTVINKGTSKMYFKIGEHTGFNAEALGDNLESLQLLFEKNENANDWNLKEGLLLHEKPYKMADAKIKLSKEMFRGDASLVLSRLKSSYVVLTNKCNKPSIRIGYKGYPYMVIWSTEDNSQFVCIEPWNGLPSRYLGSQELKEHVGINALSPDEEFSCSIFLEISL